MRKENNCNYISLSLFLCFPFFIFVLFVLFVVVTDLITAGIELMSHTLCFILYFVSMEQEIQDKIYKEVSELNDHLTHDDLRKAVHTRAAIQETYRISPTGKYTVSIYYVMNFIDAFVL